MAPLRAARRAPRSPVFGVLGVLGLSLALAATSCALDSPVEVTNRPLAERLADRRAAAVEVEQAALDAVSEAASSGEDAGAALAGAVEDAAPEALALTDADLYDTPGLVLVANGNGIGVELKDGPGSGYRMIANIPTGSELVTLGAVTGEWTYVAYGDFDGWVYSELASLADASGAGIDPVLADAAPTTYVVSDEVVGVNMRLGPSVDTELVSGAPAGSIVQGTGRTMDEWVEVTFNGVTGWAHGRYLVVD